MLEKEKHVWTEIIETYRDMPFLWNKKHFNYQNRDMRLQAIKILLKKYQLYDEDATVDLFKKKLENMRTTYNRELKKFKASQLPDSNTHDVYIPSLWYFDLFEFLQYSNQPCHEQDETNNSFDDIDEDSKVYGEETVPFCSYESPTEQTDERPIKKQRRSIEWKRESPNDSTNNSCTVTEAEWDVIGKSIGIQLKNLKKQQLAIAQKLISDTIFYAKMGKLCEDSSVTC